MKIKSGTKFRFLCDAKKDDLFPNEKDALQKLLKFNNPHVKRVVEGGVDVQTWKNR